MYLKKGRPYNHVDNSDADIHISRVIAIHYAPTLTIFLVAVALAAMSSLSDSLLTTLFFFIL